jgi:hypothetical protein
VEVVSEFDVGISTHIQPTGEVAEEWFVEQHDDAHTVAFGTREEVVEQMRKFIADASHALTDLLALKPCDHQWVDDDPERKDEHTHNGGTARRVRCRRCDKASFAVVDRSTAAPWYAEQYYGSDQPDLTEYWRKVTGWTP